MNKVYMIYVDFESNNKKQVSNLIAFKEESKAEEVRAKLSDMEDDLEKLNILSYINSFYKFKTKELPYHSFDEFDFIKWSFYKNNPIPENCIQYKDSIDLMLKITLSTTIDSIIFIGYEEIELA